jgi:nicotinamide mononucleotide transporter
MSAILDWFSNNYIEFLATLTSIIYVIFSVKQNILLWPFGLISSGLYVYTFFNAGIYADMGLYFYYVVMSIYGWYMWSKSKNTDSGKSEIISLKGQNKMVFTLVLATVITFILILFVLINLTDSTIPYIDAFTTSISFVATWMLAKRYLEQWHIWIFVNIISCGVYFYKELYITVLLFFGLAVMAVVGLKEWSKDFKMELKNA